MLKLLIITIILVGLAMAAIAIKMFVKKDGEFKKTCGSTDPATGQKIGCACGGGEDSSCENKGHHHHESPDGHHGQAMQFEKITAQ